MNIPFAPEAGRTAFPETHEPGVYFGMPEEEYHADPSFSSSGAKQILVTPLTYWIHSRLNPDFEDHDSDSKRFGRAMHKRIVEGEAAFLETYAVEPDIADFPGALDGASMLREHLGALGLKKSGTIAEMCERIRDAAPDTVLWPDIVADFRTRNIHRTIISKDSMREINTRARIVEAHPDASRAFSGGVPEVSIFWIDGDTGVPMKCRLDYLKAKAVIDQKNFANLNDAPPEIAFVNRSLIQYRYDVQAVIYLHGLKQAIAMPDSALRGPVDMDWWRQVQACEDHAFFFVAIQSGPVPNVVVKQFVRHYPANGERMDYFVGAWRSYRRAVETFADCLKRFGTDRPWIDHGQRQVLHDEDLPLWFSERTMAE